ncbi:MAG: macrolide ABC transporter ATP-binding protein [Coxiella sp. DG_40]|nr:MAG: macrolide ABC transporter ATP-binding protein [Coxiella sp. DG_40]
MIELNSVNKTYRIGKIEVKALQDVSLKIVPGEFVAIIGPSGSGKSTLLHILGFLDKPDSGSYSLNGKETSDFTDDELALLRNQMAGFVFQQFYLLPRMTALENVELPLIYAGKKESTQIAKEKIAEVGLAHRESHRPNELSGGEQQRIAIARSLVKQPLIILADEPTGNLDTKTEKEIISIFKRLNDRGQTIIMVTHEKDIAEHAKRIIEMRDGRIIGDRTIDRKSALSPKIIPVNNILTRSQSVLGTAKFVDHLRQALNAVVTHKMRSFLSMLGILIGVAAVITMLALGEGAKQSMSERLASLGTNLLTIRPGARHMGGVFLEAGAVTRFTLEDAEAISKLPLVKSVSPYVIGRGQLVYSDKNWNTQIMGVGVDYAVMRASIPIAGRFFTKSELIGRQKVALLGLTVVGNLFENKDPIGSTIKINRINFRVIGILPKKGSSFHGDQDDVVIIPVTTAMYRLLGREYVNSIDAEIKQADLMEKAKDSISNLIIKRHRISETNQNSFTIRNMAEIQEILEGTTQTMAMLLGFIAAISLLVGGVGIMNIMLVSVTERTKEIGLRKAIGARKRDIMMQFLVESVVMTLSGGIMGIVFGVGAAILLTIFVGWVTEVSLYSIIITTAFSIGVGIVFGLLPAKQASKLDPIQALRYG